MPVIDELKRATGNDELHFLELDLADLAQVKACAQQWISTNDRLDVLINNAGCESALAPRWRSRRS